MPAHPNSLAMMVDLRDGYHPGRGIIAVAGEHSTAAAISLMARHARGLISLAMLPDKAIRLGLRPMARSLISGDACEYLSSFEAKACTETGISAAERALTAKVASAGEASAEAIVTPGHMIPLLVRNPDRAGATLPEVALSALLREGRFNTLLWCDVLNDAGDVASAAECCGLAARLGLDCIEIAPWTCDAGIGDCRVAA
ncbi:3,4-dihydroxy-2-butanone-4-phosphate synthase [Novosphingobium sp. Gsoil 351]|uniref:3,4-dihydroxy-2-butanone-4-phosphate synthase n=1 Tax=Novosphingobium sp. Gsoil 351 TaxID=2675225 RepID=UPI0012B491AE|nr:3,4-dihydroxy-2-butanone-4-phosphate synthase [Novosphingobium sp. Gsoil 351]QGN55499.1 hypothetical protein GKE62_13995 [Novosphingobium sp. Gsoil 351]